MMSQELDRFGCRKEDQFDLEGIVQIPHCGLYAKSQTALDALFRVLRERGYELEYLGDDAFRRYQVSVEEQRARGSSMWYARRRKTEDSFSIYEAWHFAPLAPSPRLHEKIIRAAGMVSDCGYYYQDGSKAFFGIHLYRMRLFVEHLTALNLEAWDKMIAGADKSGPGMIRAIATFCSSCPQITNQPNPFNVIIGVEKMSRGGRLTTGELEAIVDAVRDEDCRKDLKKFFE